MRETLAACVICGFIVWYARELIQLSVSAFFLYIYILARVHNTKTFLYYELLILERKTSALMKNYPVVGRAGYQKTKKYLPSVAVTAGFWPFATAKIL